MVLKGRSLLLCAFALLGLPVAALAWRYGARRVALVASVLCAAAVAVSLAPVARAQQAASAENVRLSLPGYFAGPALTTHRPTETATYARPEGEELKVDVWRPHDGPGADAGAAEARPAVIVVHGGGWRSGTRGEFPRWNAWLADRGYVVFDIDYRLSPPPSWRDAPADVRCAIAWAKEDSERYGVDPERVALMGRSAGGHLALLAAYTRGPVTPTTGCEAGDVRDTGVAAVAAFYPPTDLARLSSRGDLPGIDRFLGGSRQDVPDRYRLLSPVSRVDPGDPPTFLVHGGDDQIVPPAESGLLAEDLREAGVPHRLVELPWANHTFDFLWGGWGSQITRSSLEAFLEARLGEPEGTSNNAPTPNGRAPKRKGRTKIPGGKRTS